MPDSQRSEPIALTPAAAGPAAAVLALNDDALAPALAAMATEPAAAAVAAAPSLEQKTRLLWAMRDRQRVEVLERLSPILIAALVQNLEPTNRALLGDLSFPQFQRILALCDPAQQYHWLRRALAFTDARANALPLLLPNEALVEALLSRAEFVDHARAFGDYPVEDLRLPPEALADPAQALIDLFGPAILREIPVHEPRLAEVLQAVVDHDPDRYADLIRRALARIQYADEHEEAEGDLREAPLLLDPVDARAVFQSASPASEEAPGPATGAPDETPADALLPAAEVGLLPAGTGGLLGQLAVGIPLEREVAVGRELQSLVLREAIAAGGSFARTDLAAAARRVESTLLLGLQVAGGESPTATLSRQPLTKVLQAGARVVERLRQGALRLRPLREVLDAEQWRLVESLCQPQLTLTEAGRPALELPGREELDLPEALPVGEAGQRLETVVAWAAVARALTLSRTAAALAAVHDTQALVAGLALGAVLYLRVEWGLSEASDLRRFADRYLSTRGRPRAAARASLRRALAPWVAAHGLDPPATLALFEEGLERLAEAVTAAGPSAPALRDLVFLGRPEPQAPGQRD
jgi:hypothetical protein